jgi:hypothetical protein
LVIATLVQTPQVEPNLRDIWIDTDGTRISIQGIPILVDLEIENTDRTPESGITAITIHGLLIGLVCLVVFLTSHIGTTKEVPALGIVGGIGGAKLIKATNRLRGS